MTRHARPHSRLVAAALALLLLATSVEPRPSYAATPAAAHEGTTSAEVVSAPVTTWPQYRGDAQKTGRATWPYPDPPRGGVYWRAEVGPMLDASPVVDTQGTIYVGTLDPARALVALNPDGSQRWATRLPDQAVRATPAIRGDGTLVVVANRHRRIVEDGVLERFDPLAQVHLVSPSGALLTTSRELDGLGLASPTIDAHDNAYLWYPIQKDGIGYGFGMVKYDPSLSSTGLGGLAEGLTGDAPLLAWICTGGALVSTAGIGELLCSFGPYHPGPQVQGTLDLDAPDPVDGLIPSAAFSPEDDGLTAAGWDTLRVTTTGATIWHNGANAYLTPAVGMCGRAYLATYDADGGHLRAQNADGSTRWDVGFGEDVMIVAPPAIGVGPVNPADAGTLRCEQGGRDHRQLTSADALYVPMSDGALYALDASGRLRWQRSSAGRVIGAPVAIELQDGREIVLASDDRGLLQAFDRDGAPLWTVQLDSPARGTPAVAHGHIYVATETSVYAIGAPLTVQTREQ